MVVRAGDTDFYGIIQDIVEVQYPGLVNLKCTLFKCEWFDPVVRRGVRVRKFGVIDVNGSRSYAKYDPFVLASQADQVCFIPYPRVRKTGISWLCVQRIAPRGMIVESDDAPMQYKTVMDLTTPEQDIDNIILIDPQNREAEILPDATDAENPENELFGESGESTDEDDDNSNDDSDSET
ncbi:DUF4216 domain-containing protein [Escherichia coli]|nr:DUF4216 domain-containing protein [Escherichia coli]MBW1279357.1 DUF4216 domain-containing protein [Escherichia coli]